MKAKKIIVGILIFIAALIMLAALNTVHAEGLGYLKISKERTATEKFVIDPEKLQQLFPMSAMSQDLELMEAQAMGPEVASQAVTKEFKLKYKYQLYSQNGGQTKNIWKLVSCSNAQGTESTVQLKDLYCLRAGLGFMAEGNADSPDNVRNYTLQYDLPAEYEGIKKLFAGEEGSTEITIFKEENRDDLNAVLWILDHMLLEDASDEALNTYLKEYAGYSDEDLSKEPLKENVLTRSDIEAIQQLALWYFTNEEAGEAGYHNETLPTLFIDIDDEDGETYLYSTHEEEQDEEDSYKQFSDIFNNKGIQHGQYGTERQNKAEALYKKLIQQAQEEAKKVTEGLYKAQRDITVYFAGTNAKAEQPVVQVKEKKPYVDVALRKFITKINEKELRNEDGTFEREPKVDTSKLNDVVDGKVVKTADYNHTKQPVKVTVGDKVVYRLRIYNEGEVDTHITKVKDHLPEYLDCNDNEWTYDEHTHTATSKDECKIVGVGGKLTDSDGSKVGTTNLKDVLIPAAEKKSDAETDSEDDYTLSYVDIEIECTVNAKINNRESFGKKITNIAEIAEMTDRDNQPLKEDRDSVPDGKNNPNGGGEKVPLDNTTGEELEKYKDQEIENQKQEHDNNDEWNYIPGQEDDDDFEKLYVGSPDVALRKFITQIGDTPVTDRVPNVDSTKLNKGNTTTADYNHTKQPKRVEIGDKITYTLRVYNEGDIDVYITEITDHLPPELTYDEEENTQWELKDVNKAVSLAESCKVVNAGGKLVASEQKGKLLKEVLIPAAEYNEETGDYTLSYVDVEIVCTVLATAKPGQKITNIAEITKMENANHVVMEDDRDSKPDGNKDGNPVVEGAPAEDYKDPAIKDQKQKHDNGEDWNYIPGQEDDDDFEKVYVPEPAIDLALRKFITAINGVEKDDLKDRIPNDITDSTLKAGDETADYEHSKQPYQVNIGDIITYTIRIYNEGEVDGIVSELKDYLATYLEYVPSAQEGNTPWWTEEKGETQNVLTSTEDIIAVGANISGDEAKSQAVIGQKIKDIVIPAYDKEKDILSYIDVKVNCKVLPVTETTKMTNIAEITKELNKDGETPADDRDSIPDGKKDENGSKVPTGTPTEDYKDPQIEDQKEKHDEDEKWEYIPGEEDDDDFEKVVVKPKFDLALRKFITKVENTDVNNRYPTPTMKEDGNIKYVHPKDPVPVGSGDTVIYTIRIFNEGEADGFAEEITDDYPKGLEFLVDNEVNKEYRWKMLDENEEETDDITKAKYLVTDYLSEAQGIENNRDNKIKAFNKDAGLSDTNPDYRDVKIAFKVTYVPTTKAEAERIIVNEAQISKDSDDDIDSEPHRDEVYDKDDEDENDDDIDYDNVIVKYFDLSLLKWVAKTRVTLNGETVETDTGHNAENSKNEPQVKIEIPEKDLNKIVIKYVYTIRVTNEGELEGYAEEIRDYIPAGLRFEEEDNTEWNWKMQEDGTITTDYFKDTLLKPGDYVEVPVILTWINDPENLGEKVNLAEISVDRTPGNTDVPDVDSTPDNKIPDEDDIDDAPVILAVKSGMANIYIGLIGIVLVTFAAGVSLIKKYVLL